MRAVPAALVLAALLIASCGPVPFSPDLGALTVYLDEGLSVPEGAAVLSGLDAWHDAVPEVVFVPVPIGHDALTAAVLRGARGIFVSRSVDAYDSSCPDPQREIGPSAAGVEWSYGVGRGICLDAQYLDGAGEWRKATMHEIGHALGLGHSPAPSVMAPVLGTGSDDPTADDVARLRAVWGLS